MVEDEHRDAPEETGTERPTEHAPLELSFLVSGVDAEGGRSVERITASSATEAAAAAATRGWTDVLLHDDEPAALQLALSRRIAAEGGEKLPPLPPPAVELANRASPPRAWQRWLERLTRVGPIAPIAGVVALFVIAFFLDVPWWGIVLLALATVVVFTYGGMIRPGVAYGALLEALQQHRTEDAHRALDRLESALSILRLTGAVGRIELLSRRAQIVAEEGHPDRALELLEPLRSELGVPEWLYQTKVAEVMDAANQHERALAAQEAAVAAAPPSRELWTDLAFRRAVYGEDAAGARAAWKTALTLPETEGVRRVGRIQEAAILLAEGRTEAAMSLLEDPVERAEDPMFHPFEVLRQTLLAEALAAQGDAARARPLAEAALEKMRVLDSSVFVGRLERLLADPEP